MNGDVQRGAIEPERAKGRRLSRLPCLSGIGGDRSWPGGSGAGDIHGLGVPQFIPLHARDARNAGGEVAARRLRRWKAKGPLVVCDHDWPTDGGSAVAAASGGPGLAGVWSWRPAFGAALFACPQVVATGEAEATLAPSAHLRCSRLREKPRHRQSRSWRHDHPMGNVQYDADGRIVCDHGSVGD